MKALAKLKKLKGRSRDEFRVRGAQACAAFAERRGWSRLARLPADAAFFKLFARGAGEPAPASAEQLLAHFRTRTGTAFFGGFADRERTIAALRHVNDERAEQELVACAVRIGEGRFDLLGLRDVRFGAEVDWHLEPLAGKRTPLAHWSRIDYLNAEVAGDKKITWELNRHQYFSTLGRAYWLTGDERFAETFCAHLRSWMKENPPKLGINWASSLEVAFRSISWLWAFHFFKDSTRLSPALFLDALKFLHLHARHLETYLSTYFSPNTHLTGEALALFYLGTLLPEFKDAPRWRATGRRILLAELDRHVRPDGTYFEQSSYYHRYTTDFYLHFLLLARANGTLHEGGEEGERAAAAVGAESKLEDKLLALLDHLMYITRPDGTSPLYGDDDGGRLVMLDERPANDFRAPLSTASVVFKRGDYKFVAGELAEETVWLLGADGTEAFARLAAHAPAGASRAFPDGGFYVMRDGWARDSNYLLLDCGPHGASASAAAHAHADALSFDLAARGRTLLVDPGTYTYTGSAELRDYFRTSAAHNTLTVDGESSSVPGTAFTWRHAAHARLNRWLTTQRFDLFAGEHDGYARLAAPATHERGVLFLKGDYWIMRDRVETKGAHRYDLNFHFAPDAAPQLTSAGEASALREPCGDAAPGLDLFTFARAAGAPGGAWRGEEGWVSERYRARRNAPVYIFSTSGEGAEEFITFLLPRGAAQTGGARAGEIEAVGGRAFELRSAGGDLQADGEPDVAAHDLVLIGDGGLVESSSLASDFAWTWARFAGETGELTELVLIDGSRLHLGACELLRAPARIGYLWARRAGDEWELDTDAAEEFSFTPDGARRTKINGRVYSGDARALSCHGL